MAARALSAAAAGRRMAGHTSFPLLASCRRGDQAHQNYSISAQAQPEEEQKGVHGGGGGVAGAQVEAALNRKNVEVHPDETVEGGPENAWVPDHETGVFVPADEAAISGTENHDHCGAAAAAGSSPSVLDQAVFVRDEDMEDVERPAVDMAAANHNPK